MSDLLSKMMQNNHIAVAERIANRFSQLDAVTAVAIAGSQTTGAAVPSSDIDIYIYTTKVIPAETRLSIGAEFSDNVELIDFWGPGNEWDDRETGIHCDVIYFDAAWMEDQVDRVLTRHEAWMGYTTCFWHTVRVSRVLFDRDGWFARLQSKADQPYPDALVKAIITLNYPLLRDVAPAYLHQIEKAASRGDLISLNHRTAALIASYFDILFALNKVPHPGEKRQVDFAEKLCAKRPATLREDVTAVLRASVPAEGVSGDETRKTISMVVHTLVDHLDGLLRADGLL